MLRAAAQPSTISSEVKALVLSLLAVCVSDNTTVHICISCTLGISQLASLVVVTAHATALVATHAPTHARLLVAAAHAGGILDGPHHATALQQMRKHQLTAVHADRSHTQAQPQGPCRHTLPAISH